MVKRVATVGAVGLLVLGGLAGLGKWRDGRIAECGRRSASLASLSPLSRSPDGFREVAADAACDADRVVAVASRQFLAIAGPGGDQLSGRAAEPVDEPAVTAFYRGLLTGAQWQVAAAEPAPGPDAAALCATKRLDFGLAHVSLSFPVAGMYEVAASDSPDPGARCG